MVRYVLEAYDEVSFGTRQHRGGKLSSLPRPATRTTLSGPRDYAMRTGTIDPG